VLGGTQSGTATWSRRNSRPGGAATRASWRRLPRCALQKNAAADSGADGFRARCIGRHPGLPLDCGMHGEGKNSRALPACAGTTRECGEDAAANTRSQAESPVGIARCGSNPSAPGRRARCSQRPARSSVNFCTTLLAPTLRPGESRRRGGPCTRWERVAHGWSRGRSSRCRRA